MERELAELMERAGVDMSTVASVRRFPKGLPTDLWDFSSAGECQRMLSTLVTMKGNEELPINGQDLFDALPAYDVDVNAGVDVEVLADARAGKIVQTQKYALNLTKVLVPAVDNLVMLDFLRELWPMLNKTAAGPDMVGVKNIAVNLKVRVAQLEQGTLEAVEAYDPIADLEWGG